MLKSLASPLLGGLILLAVFGCNSESNGDKEAHDGPTIKCKAQNLVRVFKFEEDLDVIPGITLKARNVDTFLDFFKKKKTDVLSEVLKSSGSGVEWGSLDLKAKVEIPGEDQVTFFLTAKEDCDCHSLLDAFVEELIALEVDENLGEIMPALTKIEGDLENAQVFAENYRKKSQEANKTNNHKGELIFHRMLVEQQDEIKRLEHEKQLLQMIVDNYLQQEVMMKAQELEKMSR